MKKTQKTISQKKSSLLENPTLWISLLLICCVAHAVWCFSLGWNNTINDHHSFRQSQTAITAFYLKDDPFKLNYETPILGKPWSIPMEFPIYQYLVARFSNLSGIALDQAGRAVAATAYLLTMIPIYALLRFRKVLVPHSLLFLCFLLVCPFYMFWSRTFMIESTALLLSFSYLACVMWGEQKKSWGIYLLATIFGILAGLCKVTTWLPFLALSGLWMIRRYLCWPIPKLENNPLLKLLLQIFVICGIPFVVTDCWVHYSDVIKEVHPLAIANTSAGLSAWNYGTTAQKLSLQVWGMIFSRIYTLFGLPLQGWLILGFSMAAVILTKRRWKEALTLVFLFLLSPLVFTNLHFIHDYYMNANGLFLLGAVGFSVLALLESLEVRIKICGGFLALFILWSGVSGYEELYRPLQEMPNSEILQLTDYIQKNTAKDSVLIVLGADWNPLVPYYSQRRSLMIPDWETLTDSQVQQALENLKGEKIGALIVCPEHRYSQDLLLQQAKSLGLDFPIIQCGQLPLR